MMMTAADIMTRRPVAIAATAAVSQAIERMKEHGISSVLVLPLPGSTEYGIVTVRDIVARLVKEDLDTEAVRVGDIMTWRLVTAHPSWPVRKVAEVMAKARVRRLPVVEGSDIVGLVSDTDILTSLVSRHEWDHVRKVRKARAMERASRTGHARSVADLMSAPVLNINAGATAQEAVEKMVASGISSLLVTQDQGGHGIVTKRDLVTKVVAAGRDLSETAVHTVMSSPVRSIEAEDTLDHCSLRMAAARVRRFPVTRHGEIVGIISDSDILAAVAGHRWIGHRRYPTSAIAADVMRTPSGELQPVPTETLTPELSIWECAERLARADVRELSVVQEGRIIGVVGEGDILRAIQERGGPD